MFRKLDLKHIFGAHDLDIAQGEQAQQIREGAEAFAQLIVDNTPGSADQTAAVRHVMLASMTAVHAIATGGRMHEEDPLPQNGTSTEAFAETIDTDQLDLLNGGEPEEGQVVDSNTASLSTGQ